MMQRAVPSEHAGRGAEAAPAQPGQEDAVVNLDQQSPNVAADGDAAAVATLATCAEVFQLHRSGDGGGALGERERAKARERAYDALVEDCDGAEIVCLGENTCVHVHAHTVRPLLICNVFMC